MSEELEIMKLISIAGDSKSKAFEALKYVKSKDFDKARELIKESRELDTEAHNIQTGLITKELNQDEKERNTSLLMVHAQDHYMTSQLSRDLIEELIGLFEEQNR